jgi:hypothetical protein
MLCEVSSTPTPRDGNCLLHGMYMQKYIVNF